MPFRVLYAIEKENNKQFFLVGVIFKFFYKKSSDFSFYVVYI